MGNGPTQKFVIPTIQNALPLDKATGQHPPGFLMGLATPVTSNPNDIKNIQGFLQPLSHMPIIDAEIIVEKHENRLGVRTVNHLIIKISQRPAIPSK
ncbi:MAG: hypothetical protein NTZ53_06695 [Cyanobacteria bacterium]|nr:hypothetical protein [Cyanobacteriota bacterium]